MRLYFEYCICVYTVLMSKQRNSTHQVEAGPAACGGPELLMEQRTHHLRREGVLLSAAQRAGRVVAAAHRDRGRQGGDGAQQRQPGLHHQHVARQPWGEGVSAIDLVNISHLSA